MSKQLYKRYLRLVSQWPKDTHKSRERDLAVFLSSQVQSAFSSETPPNAAECERKILDLGDILSNKFSSSYPHSYKSGVFGLNISQLETFSSEEGRTQLGLIPKKSLAERFSLFNSSKHE